MKMKKRVTAVLAAVCMTALCVVPCGHFTEKIGTAPISAGADVTQGQGGMITFTMQGDGELHISGQGAIKDYSILSGDKKVPASV